MLRVDVIPAGDQARLALFGDDGALLVEWTQDDADDPEVRRSTDGAIATIVAGEVITVVRLVDGAIAATARAGRGTEAILPLDERWTIEVAGELVLDGGHTPFNSGRLFFIRWPESGALPPGEVEADIAWQRTGLAAAACVGIHRRIALRHDGGEVVVVHESTVPPVDGGEALLWPPVVGPAGVLLRHAIETDDGKVNEIAPQRPWLVRPDRTVARLPFELGVSPLVAMPDGRWLLPGADPVWRDDYDEPLSVLAENGALEPLLVGDRPVPTSRVLREVAPELLAALAPVDRDDDVPWGTVDARLDPEADELHLAIAIVREDQAATLIAALPLDGRTPARLVDHIEPAPGRRVALAL